MASPEVLESRQPLKKVTFEEERRDIRRRRTPPPRYPHRRSFRKRSHSFTEGSFKKSKNSESNVLPSKFLLGGNIRDPLNLNSLSDERISEIVNAITPESSPLPTPKHRKAEYKIRVLIPPNITDPLNLNAGVDEREYESRLRKKIRHRKRAPSSKKDDLPPPLALPPPKPSKKQAQTPGVEEGGALTEESPKATTSRAAIESAPKGETSKEHKKKKNSEPSEASPPPKKRARHASPCPVPKATPLPTPKDVGPKFKDKNKKFQYGNYNRYYGYRKQDASEEDLRLRFLKPEWFTGKKVLDIGCNVGKLTDAIARTFFPKSLTGMDIDKDLINVARKNLRKCRDAKESGAFPKSMSILYGSISAGPNGSGEYPSNLGFICGNYVLDSDALLDTMVPEFHTIICFSTTKWIHLNFGDDGLKRAFKRIYAQLHPGGLFILEAQGLASYRKKKKLTPRIFENFKSIKLRPEGFGEYLINEVGFESRELVAVPQHPARGFQRPIQVFVKPSKPASEASLASSPAPVIEEVEEVPIIKGEEKEEAPKVATSPKPSCSAPKPSTSKAKGKPKSSPYYTIGGGPTPPGRTPSIGMTPQYDLGTPCYNPEELDIPPGGYYGYNTPGITPGYSGPSPDGYSNIDPPIQRHHSPVYTGPPPGTFSGASTPGNEESGYTPHYSGYTPSHEGGGNASARRNVYTYSPGNATPSPRTNSAPSTPHASPGTPNPHASPGTPIHNPASPAQLPRGGNRTSSNNAPPMPGPSSGVSTTASLLSPQIQQSEVSGNTTPHPGTSISPANSDQHRYLWYGCSSSGGTTPQSGIEDPSSSPKVPCPSPSQQDSNPSTPVSDDRPESASP
eukprot:TRINITY_DN23383_c0_g1_i1.p1 TRINITY_DN23383_c0_g1~~TRINITY_DN23383_c0_g1_i1.p1  ORF type:complete len:849 (+),score=265.59 TRINITY_DN23383_c0_g1_i1:44-2590(+)